MAGGTIATGWHSAQTALGREVVKLLSHLGERRSFDAGTRLWSAGDPATRFLALEVGQVRIFRELADGRTLGIFLFGPGDVFGFMPVLDGGTYPASAEALTEVEGLTVPRAALLEAFEHTPRLAGALVSLLSRRLRDAFDRLEDAAGTSSLPRVATALLSLLPPEGPAPNHVLGLPVKSGEFAAALGMAPETFSRTLTALVREGVLHRLGGRRYQILDPERLRAFAAGRSSRG